MRIYLELMTEKCKITLHTLFRNKTRNAWMEESCRYGNTESLTTGNDFINAKIKVASNDLTYIYINLFFNSIIYMWFNSLCSDSKSKYLKTKTWEFSFGIAVKR